MPHPPDSFRHVLREETSPAGDVTRSLQVGLPDLPGELERDLRVHRSLSGAHPAGHELRDEANKAVRVSAPGHFTKYRVLLRDPARVGWVAFDREVSSSLGGYDDLIPPSSEIEDYCPASTFLSVMFDGVPAQAVEVFLYAGRLAQPK